MLYIALKNDKYPQEKENHTRKVIKELGQIVAQNWEK